MSEIKALYSRMEKDRLCAGGVTFNGKEFELGETVPVSSVGGIKTRTERGQVLVIDVDSINDRRFNPGLVSGCRVSGNDVWLVESISFSSDILDAFLGDLCKLVMPIGSISSRAVLEDAVGLSDDCVPFIECVKGRSLGNAERIEDLAVSLSGMGFRQIMVADLDGGVPDRVWEALENVRAETIAYRPCSSSPDGIEDVFPYRLSMRSATPKPYFRAILRHSSRSPVSVPPISSCPSHSDPTVTQTLLRTDLA